MPISRGTCFKGCACLNASDCSRTVPEEQTALAMGSLWEGKLDGVRQAFQPDLHRGAIV
jgi:hypothetical protein